MAILCWHSSALLVQTGSFVYSHREGGIQKMAKYPGLNYIAEDIHRNSDINTFSDAIELILGQGGIVVRMGSIVTQELTYKHPRVIDYPHSGIRSDFLDVFLAAHCRFFLGTTSGICDLSVVFDVPNLRVNFTPPGGAPWGKESLFIPKRVHSKFTGKYVSFDKLINQFSVNSPNLWDGFYQYKTFWLSI